MHIELYNYYLCPIIVITDAKGPIILIMTVIITDVGILLGIIIISYDIIWEYSSFANILIVVCLLKALLGAVPLSTKPSNLIQSWSRLTN